MLKSYLLQVEYPLGVKPIKTHEIILVDGEKEHDTADVDGDAESALALVERLNVFTPDTIREATVDYHTALFALVMEANRNFKAGEREPAELILK